MGLLAGYATKKATAFSRITWIRPVDPTGFLDDGRLAYLSALRILGRVGTLESLTSTWLETARSTSPALLQGTSSGSLLRIDAEVRQGFTVALGALSPACRFVPDWVISAILDGTGGLDIGTAYHRTIDKKLLNKATFETVRFLLSTMFINDPVTLTLSPGAPNFDAVIAPMLLPPGSPFADFLQSLPDAVHHGLQIVFPAGAADRIAAEFLSAGFPCPPPDGAWLCLDVSYGSDVPATLSFHVLDELCWIELRCPDFAAVSNIAQQRIARHTVLALRSLAGRLEGESAAVTLHQHIARIAAGKPNTNESSVHPLQVEDIWTTKKPAPALQVGADRYLPVGILATSQESIEFSDLAIAERSLAVRHRGRLSGGFTKKARVMTYTARRPVGLVVDGQVQPSIRYVESPQLPMDEAISGGPEQSCFWQAELLTSPPQDGLHKALLIADIVSTASGVLAYGTELATLFRTWSNGLRLRDPNVDIQTLYLWI